MLLLITGYIYESLLGSQGNELCIEGGLASTDFAHGQENSFQNIYLYEYILVMKNIIKSPNWVGGWEPSCMEVVGSSPQHYKGKLHSAGRKIIVLPQVKNIVALLKSECQARLHY